MNVVNQLVVVVVMVSGVAVVAVVWQSTSFGSERLPSSFGDDFPR
jgi:hypothetical protein